VNSLYSVLCKGHDAPAAPVLPPVRRPRVVSIAELHNEAARASGMEADAERSRAAVLAQIEQIKANEAARAGGFAAGADRARLAVLQTIDMEQKSLTYVPLLKDWRVWAGLVAAAAGTAILLGSRH
jgi:hypothetical protein